jgi:hypothetical protein
MRHPDEMRFGQTMSGVTRRGLMTVTVAVALGIAAGGWSEVAAQTPPAEIKPPVGLELTAAQRQLIFASISQQTHQSTAAPADFGPAVGAQVPAAIELTPMPETIVEVVPQTRGHAYAFIGGRVLIVEPKARQIVEVIGPEQNSPTRT